MVCFSDHKSKEINQFFASLGQQVISEDMRTQELSNNEIIKDFHIRFHYRKQFGHLRIIRLST